ncbi:MAG: GNAT family N-acetyltransferase [Alphaproteobacteria bacterium]
MMWQEKYIRLETKNDFLDSENFLDNVFGLGRHARTINFLRRNIHPDNRHSFHYRDASDNLLGLIRFYHIILADKTKASLMGPVAIRYDKQKQGLGSFLITYGLSLMDKNYPAKNYMIFLVGNDDYYKRHGFCKVNLHDDTKKYSIGGPIAPLSLLVRCHDNQEILKHQGQLYLING